MKKLIILIFCFTSLNAFADCQLRVRVTDYKPQYYQNEQGKWRGMAVELAEVLLKEAKCKPVYEISPWKRSLLLLKEGNLDMMMNLSITDERKKYLNFIGPQRDETILIAVRKEFNFEINSLEDIKKLPGRIGIQIGSSFGKAFDSKYKSDPDFAKKFTQSPRQIRISLNLR